MTSLMLGHGFLPPLPQRSSIMHSFYIISIEISHAKYLSTCLQGSTNLEVMKPTIPPESSSLQVEQSPSREEASLHGEILGRLRDYLVEGNIPEGSRIPERQLC